MRETKLYKVSFHKKCNTGKSKIDLTLKGIYLIVATNSFTSAEQITLQKMKDLGQADIVTIDNIELIEENVIIEEDKKEIK